MYEISNVEKASMVQSKLRSGLQIGLVLGILAVVAIPLSELLIANANPEAGQPTALTQPAGDAEAIEAGEGSSAVSALVAGNAVGGGRRGATFGLRRPASAFVP